MAVVFRARDERLGRPVALKILAPGLASDEEFRRRFIAESRAAAAVDDPHIIPVYEAGEAGGVLFIAMRFVAGGDLRRVLAREGPLEPGRAAEFLSPVASALDAAHRAGLVHRDVKPANILVDAQEDRPDHVYLSDFGVSKGASSSVSLTGTGQYLGTPEYSAPEQIQGRAADGRVDQYALACVAYQLLTGAVPFRRDQGMAVLLAHLSEPPPSLGSLRPGLSAAADQVLARALAKVPEKRFGSCRDFAGALREALGLPRYTSAGPDAASRPRTEISVQPAFPWQAAAGTADGRADPADNLAVTGGSSPATVGAFSQPAGTAGESGRLGLELDALTASADRPPSAQDLFAAGRHIRPGPDPPDDGAQPGRRRRRLLPITLVCVLLAAGAAVSLILTATKTPGHAASGAAARSSIAASGAPARSSTAASGAASPLSCDRNPSGPANPVEVASFVTSGKSSDYVGVAFSPDCQILAVGDHGNVQLRDLATDSTIATLPAEPGGVVNGPVFSPDGTTIAVPGGDGVTTLWNTATHQRISTLDSDPGGGTYCLAFSPDGSVLATGGSSGVVVLWDTANGEQIATLTTPTSVGYLALSPNGRLLAVGGNDGTDRLWDMTTRSQVAALPGGKGHVWSMAFSPDSKTLAIGTYDGYLQWWNVDTGKLIAEQPAGNGSVTSVAFSPSGNVVAAGGGGIVQLWNVRTHQLITTLTTGRFWSQGLAFSRNGAILAVGLDGGVQLWNVAGVTPRTG
jgi:Tol biopolymer transport system component